MIKNIIKELEFPNRALKGSNMTIEQRNEDSEYLANVIADIFDLELDTDYNESNEYGKGYLLKSNDKPLMFVYWRSNENMYVSLYRPNIPFEYNDYYGTNIYRTYEDYYYSILFNKNKYATCIFNMTYGSTKGSALTESYSSLRFIKIIKENESLIARYYSNMFYTFYDNTEYTCNTFSPSTFSNMCDCFNNKCLVPLYFRDNYYQNFKVKEIYHLADTNGNYSRIGLKLRMNDEEYMTLFTYGSSYSPVVAKLEEE